MCRILSGSALFASTGWLIRIIHKCQTGGEQVCMVDRQTAVNAERTKFKTIILYTAMLSTPADFPGLRALTAVSTSSLKIPSVAVSDDGGTFSTLVFPVALCEYSSAQYSSTYA